MMASWSGSGSPLQHGDTSSNTDVVPEEGNTEGSFVIRLENVPIKWKWFNISTYIRKHTEHVDKEIVNDIAAIEIKSLLRENLHLHIESWIYFKTEEIRNQALLLLEKTEEKVKKQTLTPHTFDGIEKPNKALSGYYLLRLENVPLNWTYLDVKSYVKQHTVGKNTYVKDICYIQVMKSPITQLQRSYIRFKTKCYREAVYYKLLKATERSNAKKLDVYKVDDWDLYFGSTPSNDESNPTAPHTSAVPTSDKSTTLYKSTKGTLKIVNIPPSWICKNVFNYIKRNTKWDKEILENIDYIGITRLYNACYVTFKTKMLRARALAALKISKDTIIKKLKFFEVKESLKLEQIKFSIDPNSLLCYNGLNPAPLYASEKCAISDTSETNTRQDREGQYYLTFSNVPLDWKYKDVLDYVKKHTESVEKTLTENITYIQMQKDSNSPQGYICFKTIYSRELAFEILSSTNEKVEGKKIFVHKVCVPRDRSRSPLRKESNTTIDWARPIPVHTSANTLPGTPNNLKNYSYLKLGDLPYSWTRSDVDDYIRRHTDRVDKELAEDIALIQLTTVLKDEMPELHCFVHFKTVQVRNLVYLLLKKTTEIVDGKIIQVITVKRPRLTGKLGFPKDMSMITDEDGMYGLNMDALKQLDIELPLSTKVFVQLLPLDFEESQVYTLFSCAGTVEYISLEKMDHYSTATIEYEHPVQAVQAVSMFDKQKLFECNIKCNMLKYKTEMIKGFSTLGRGLGPNGTPLRNIRLTLEIKELKEYLLAQHNEILKHSNELEAQLESLIQANNTTLALKNTNPVVTNPIPILRNLLTNQSQMLLQTQSKNNSEAFDTLLSNIGNSNMDQTQTNNQSGIEPMEVDSDIQSTNNVQASPNENTTQGSNIQNASDMKVGQDNTQKGPFMTSGIANMQNLNEQGGSNMQNKNASNMKSGQDNTQKEPCKMQNNSNTQNSKTEGGSNIQSTSNMKSGQDNTQKEPCNKERGPAGAVQNNSQNLDKHGESNIQSGQTPDTQNLNTQSGSNMQRAPNMQFGSNNTQKIPVLLQTPSVNMQNFNTQGGYNMQGAYNMQSAQNTHGPSMWQNVPAHMQNFNKQGGFNTQFGPNTQHRPFITPNCPANMQTNMQNNPYMQCSEIGGLNQFAMQTDLPNPQENNIFGVQQLVSNMQAFYSMQNAQQNKGSSSKKEAQLSVVQFKNLPPSFTQPIMKTKMAAIGNVKFIQMNNGTALVNFNSHLDADKCYRLWNQSRQDGHIIEVRKI